MYWSICSRCVPSVSHIHLKPDQLTNRRAAAAESAWPLTPSSLTPADCTDLIHQSDHELYGSRSTCPQTPPPLMTSLRSWTNMESWRGVCVVWSAARLRNKKMLKKEKTCFAEKLLGTEVWAETMSSEWDEMLQFYKKGHHYEKMHQPV